MFEGQFTCLEENTKKSINFFSSSEKKKLKELIKMEKNYKNYIKLYEIYWKRKIYGQLIIKFC